jgi:hypothetical protein
MLRELEILESLDDYIVDDFKWKKLSLNVNLSNKSIKFSVNDNNQKHILDKYLEKLIYFHSRRITQSKLLCPKSSGERTWTHCSVFSGFK